MHCSAHVDAHDAVSRRAAAVGAGPNVLGTMTPLASPIPIRAGAFPMVRPDRPYWRSAPVRCYGISCCTAQGMRRITFPGFSSWNMKLHCSAAFPVVAA